VKLTASISDYKIFFVLRESNNVENPENDPYGVEHLESTVY
jgi:hypothetical protein